MLRNGRSVGVLVAAAVAVAVTGAGCSSSAPARKPATSARATTASTAPPTAPVATPSLTPASTAASVPAPRTSASTARHAPARARATSAPAHRTSGGSRLPLGFDTASARQVITVVASSTSSTRATLQAWRKAATGWRRVGPAVAAWVGSDGLSRHPSESRSATPIGSFTLTQAFGHDSDPGTALPYVHTTPADWWISEAGPLYNTRQRCSSGCSFTRGDPNEHLYYETPYYDYAVVIDYNTRNAPGGVRQGAGSAFFLHVTVGAPTAGCVSIPKDQLVRILRWLDPAAHPRILIGVS